MALPGPDQPDWMNRLRALAATGHNVQADADQLAHFADHGWLLMEGAAEPEFVDALVDDIRKAERLASPHVLAIRLWRGGRAEAGGNVVELQGSAGSSHRADQQRDNAAGCRQAR